MMVIEMREAAKEKAFELIDEIEDLERQKKLALCELEDTLYDCFEDSKDEESEEKPEKSSEEGTDLGFKSKYVRKYGMRNFDDEDDMGMPYSKRYRMRMRRRNRMGQYM